MIITKEIAEKVLAVVDQGLCSGLGQPIPGRMCIEAAVCFALGEPHNDNPSCVAGSVRSFKIRLNDSAWSSNTARAAGMRQLAVAQLGSKGTIDEPLFSKELSKLTIQRVLPVILRARGLYEVADRCEREGTEEAARAADYAARAAAARAAAYSAAAAADSAARAAAAYSAAAAAADSAARAADSAACAADSAAYARAADKILTISASCCLDALRHVNAPGIKLLKDTTGIPIE